MNKLYESMKRMLPVAENVGTITGVALNENWCGLFDRIEITGLDWYNRRFELTLEIQLEEEEKDAEKLE